MRKVFEAAGAAILLGAAMGAQGAAAQDVTADTVEDFNIQLVAEGLDHPWGLAFLPNGDLLVTELTGQLRLIRNGEVANNPVSGVPESLYGGQGGLSDVVLHPDFESNRLVYLTYSVATDEGNTLRVGRGEFTGTALENFEVIYEADAYRDTKVHYGARMTFLPDGTFIVTNGDGFNYREQAQVTTNHFGAAVRLNADGSVPQDNPFVGNDEVSDEIFTYGHRNPQAVLYDAETDTIYQNEHGPRGGDEINVLEAGANYGWPLATYGMDYSGAYVSPYTEYEGTKQPLLYWTPSIAPSGMTMYRGDAFPAWDGDLLVTALAAGNVEEFADKNLRRVDLENGEVVGQVAIRIATANDNDQDPPVTPRLRDVRTAPDGSVYILTDGEGGKVLRLVPASGMPMPEPEPEPAAAVMDDPAADADDAGMDGEDNAAMEGGVEETVGEAVEGAAETTGEALQEGAEELGEAAGTAAEVVTEAAEEGGEAAMEALEGDTPAEDAAQDAAEDAASADAADEPADETPAGEMEEGEAAAE